MVEPFSKRLALYLRWSLALTMLFVATYGVTNWAASQRETRVHLYLDQELRIPFVPWMIWVYLSVNGLLVMPLFAADCAGINRYGRACAAATIIAALFHLALPAELGWARPAGVPGYPVFDRFFALDRPHNLVPSLHVTYSFLSRLALNAVQASGWMRILAALWMVLLVISVVLVHQHHLSDVVTGLALGAVCHYWLGRKR